MMTDEFTTAEGALAYIRQYEQNRRSLDQLPRERLLEVERNELIARRAVHLVKGDTSKAALIRSILLLRFPYISQARAMHARSVA